MAIHQKSSDDAIPDDIKVEWGLTPKQIKQAQQKDKFCKEQYNKIIKVFSFNYTPLLHTRWCTDEIHYR